MSFIIMLYQNKCCSDEIPANQKSQDIDKVNSCILKINFFSLEEENYFSAV